MRGELPAGLCLSYFSAKPAKELWPGRIDRVDKECGAKHMSSYREAGGCTSSKS